MRRRPGLRPSGGCGWRFPGDRLRHRLYDQRLPEYSTKNRGKMANKNAAFHGYLLGQVVRPDRRGRTNLPASELWLGGLSKWERVVAGRA